MAQLFDSIDGISALGAASNSETSTSSVLSSTEQASVEVGAGGVAAAIIDQIVTGDSQQGAVDVPVEEAAEGPKKSKLVVLIVATNK